MSDLSNLSVAELDALVKEANALKKKSVEAERAVYGTHATDLVDAMIAGLDFRESESSDWAGYGLTNIPVTVDGKAYTLNVTLTDTERKTERKAARELAEARAKVEAAQAGVSS